MQVLSSLQEQTLQTLFSADINTSIKRSGTGLDDEVPLWVQHVRFVTVNDITDQRGKPNAPLYCIRQPLKGIYSGNALLAFPEEKCLALLTVLGRASKPGDVPSDALLQAGTVLLAAFISSLTNALDTTFEMGSPTKDRGDIRTILGTRVQNHVVLQVQIHASIEQQPIEGFAAFVINTTSFDEPMRGVYRFMTRIGRAPADARRAR